jgi:hypothetical protein
MLSFALYPAALAPLGLQERLTSCCSGALSAAGQGFHETCIGGISYARPVAIAVPLACDLMPLSQGNCAEPDRSRCAQ